MVCTVYLFDREAVISVRKEFVDAFSAIGKFLQMRQEASRASLHVNATENLFALNNHMLTGQAIGNAS